MSSPSLVEGNYTLGQFHFHWGGTDQGSRFIFKSLELNMVILKSFSLHISSLDIILLIFDIVPKNVLYQR